jgi:hypothetical protein
MKTSKLAAVLAIALAAGTAFAAGNAAAATVPEWLKANEQLLPSEEDKANRDRQGFPQYSY